MTPLRDRIGMKWNTLVYNFGWSDYVDWLDGSVARLAFAIPIIGYLIIFNDIVVKNLTFLELASGDSSVGLSGGARLKLLYFGLVLLGLSNLIFRLRRPYVLRAARDSESYVEMGIKNFTAVTFIELHEKIRHSGLGEFTRHGAYYDDEWDAFLDRAIGKPLERGGLSRDPREAHWAEARSQFEGLLRSILIETFFREATRTRRGWLVLCLAISVVGYVLLAIPSVDLFIKVVVAVFSS